MKSWMCKQDFYKIVHCLLLFKHQQGRSSAVLSLFNHLISICPKMWENRSVYKHMLFWLVSKKSQVQYSDSMFSTHPIYRNWKFTEGKKVFTQSLFLLNLFRYLLFWISIATFSKSDDCSQGLSFPLWLGYLMDAKQSESYCCDLNRTGVPSKSHGEI